MRWFGATITASRAPSPIHVLTAFLYYITLPKLIARWVAYLAGAVPYL